MELADRFTVTAPPELAGDMTYASVIASLATTFGNFDVVRLEEAVGKLEAGALSATFRIGNKRITIRRLRSGNA